MAGVERPAREFFRVSVRVPARLRLLAAEESEQVREEIRRAPTIWSLSEASSIEAIASRPAPSAERALAGAVLELAGQVSLLRARSFEPGGPMVVATVVELSGGGGQLEAASPLERGQRFELWIEPNPLAAPPLRAVAEVVRHLDSTGQHVAFRFDGIHPQDQDRLVAWLYGVQREALRPARGRSDR
jgi:hypothetical protein